MTENKFQRPFFDSTFAVVISTSMVGLAVDLFDTGYIITGAAILILACAVFHRAASKITDAYQRAHDAEASDRRALRSEAALARVEREIARSVEERRWERAPNLYKTPEEIAARFDASTLTVAGYNKVADLPPEWRKAFYKAVATGEVEARLDGLDDEPRVEAEIVNALDATDGDEPTTIRVAPGNAGLGSSIDDLAPTMRPLVLPDYITDLTSEIVRDHRGGVVKFTFKVDGEPASYMFGYVDIVKVITRDGGVQGFWSEYFAALRAKRSRHDREDA